MSFPNHSLMAKTFLIFDDAGRILPSGNYDKLGGVMERVKFTLLTHVLVGYLVQHQFDQWESSVYR